MGEKRFIGWARRQGGEFLALARGETERQVAKLLAPMLELEVLILPEGEMPHMVRRCDDRTPTATG